MFDIPRVGVAVCLINKGKILLGKRKGKHANGTWGFPGGHLEFGEDIENCARRELFEETGTVVDKLYFWDFTNSIYKEENRHYLTLFYFADLLTNLPPIEVREPDKCEKWEWFDWDNLPSPLMLCIQELKNKRKKDYFI